MLFANSKDKEKIMAFPGAIGFCPGCDDELMAKCGQINIWHWSHVAKDCDQNHEPESKWHIDWKLKFPPRCCEVWCDGFRADIKLDTGLVIELQNSPMTPFEANSREQHYGDMVWIINGTELGDRFKITRKGSYCTYEWKHHFKWTDHLKKKMYIHLDRELFKIEKPHGRYGWGYVYSERQFLDAFLPKQLLLMDLL